MSFQDNFGLIFKGSEVYRGDPCRISRKSLRILKLESSEDLTVKISWF